MSSREYAAQPEPEHAPVRKSASNRLPWMIAAGFAVIAVGAILFHFMSGSGIPPSPVRFTVVTPEKCTLAGEMPKISPDGKLLAFTANDSTGKLQIWVRPISSVTATALAGTEDATFPFWSPDSRNLGFFQNGKMRKIEATGGPVQTIADVQDPRGGTWGAAGMIVYSPGSTSGLMAVPEAGGTPTILTTLDSVRHDDTHRWPEFLPDGKRFLYLARSNEDEKCAIFLGSTDLKEHRVILQAKSQAIPVPGYLLFQRDRSLMAQQFDEGKAELRGDAFPIAEQIGNDPSRSFGSFSASQNGVLSLVAGGLISGERQLAWFDRSGKLLERASAPGLIYDFALSPDEKRVAYRRIDPQTRNNDVWILDLSRGTESRFTFKTSREDDPIWSPDGNKLVFDSNIDGVSNPNIKLASGVGNETVAWKNDRATYPLDWSSDGKYILCNRDDPTTKNDIWALPVGTNEKPFAVLQTPAAEDIAKFSPDCRWIVYSSNETGKGEVYVQAFPSAAGKWQVSTSGGSDPIWSRDGRKIYYIAPDKQLMEVEIKTSAGSVEQGIPKQLFSTDVDLYNNPNRFAVSRDDKRFLVNISRSESKSNPITVVMNWTSEVKSK